VKVSGLNNPMTSDDKHLFLAKVKEFYGYLHPSELKLAFDFALQGTVEVDTRHFQNFSLAYFTSIVKAYLDYRNKEAARIAHNTPQLQMSEDVAKKQAQEEFTENILRPMYKDFQKGKELIYGFTPPSIIYKNLTEHFKIKEFTLGEKMDIRQEVESQMIQPDISHLDPNRIKSVSDVLMEGQREKTIVERCQMKCIEICFKIMQENNINL